MANHKDKGRRTSKLDPIQLSRFRKEAAPKVDDVFKRTMKLLKEMLCRCEDRAFSDDFWDHERNVGKYSSDLNREVKSIGQVLANLGAMHIRIQKEAKAAADLMSFDEKIGAVVGFIEEMGKIQGLKFLKEIYPVIHDLEKRHGKAAREQLKEDYANAQRTVEASREVPGDAPSDG